MPIPAQGDQRGAHDEVCQDRAVGRQQVHLAELTENQRIDRNDGQGNQEEDEQCQILPDDDLNGADGEGVEQLVGFLLPFFRDDAHGENGDDHHEDQTAEVQHEFKVAHSRLDVVQHRAEADEQQQKRAEHICGQGVKIAAQLVFQNGDHDFSPFDSTEDGLSSLLSVSSRKMSSRFAFFSAISKSAVFFCAKAKNRALDRR